MKTKLITALRTAATALENGTFAYDWCEPNRCNCGVVACALLGTSPAKLPVPKADKGDTWSDRVGYYCPITGMPENKFFATLHSYGLTPLDIVQLEYLSNPKVVERMNLRAIKTVRAGFLKLGRKQVEVPVAVEYDEKAHLIAYLRAWAQILVEEGALDRVEVREEAPMMRSITTV
jgi:hypothetical protein